MELFHRLFADNLHCYCFVFLFTAETEAEYINSRMAGHPVLQTVGNRISPEMEIPKLLWLKNHMPEVWRESFRWRMLTELAVVVWP